MRSRLTASPVFPSAVFPGARSWAPRMTGTAAVSETLNASAGKRKQHHRKRKRRRSHQAIDQPDDVPPDDDPPGDGNFLFPRHLGYGAIHPSRWTQQQLDGHVRAAYDSWKSRYLVDAGSAGGASALPYCPRQAGNRQPRRDRLRRSGLRHGDRRPPGRARCRRAGDLRRSLAVRPRPPQRDRRPADGLAGARQQRERQRLRR